MKSTHLVISPVTHYMNMEKEREGEERKKGRRKGIRRNEK